MVKKTNSSFEKKKINLKNVSLINILIVGILLLIFLAIRITLLLTSEKSLGGDPASMAVMAMNTYNNGELHYFIYGEPYIGGAAIDSYFAIIPFSIFGVTAFAYRLVPLFFSFILMIIMYFFMKKFFGNTVALYTLALSSISPLFFSKMNIAGFAGYMETLLLFVTISFLFYEIFLLNKNQTRNLIFAAILFGIGWWNLEYIIVFLLYFIVFWYLIDKKFFLTKQFFIFFISLILALSPLIYYNATNNFANAKHFMAGNAIHRFACTNNLLPNQMSYGDRILNPCQIFLGDSKSPFSITYFFTVTLTEIFGNLFYYFISLTLLLFLIITNFKSILLCIKALWPTKKFNLKLNEHSKELFLLGFLLFWITTYILSGFTDSRHFFPIFSFILMLVSVSLVKIDNLFTNFMRNKKSKTKFHSSKLFGFINIKISYVLIFILLLSSLFANLNDFKTKDTKSITNLVNFLEVNNITYVYTDHPTKWRLLFYTNEKIIASCNICQCVNQYPKIENLMQNKPDTSYVFYNSSSLIGKLTDYLDKSKISYKTYSIDNKMVIYNLSHEIDPIEVLTPCNWEKEQDR